MRWWSVPSDGHRGAVESITGGVLWQQRRVMSPANTVSCSAVQSWLWRAAIPLVKKKCIPFCGALLQIRSGSGVHFAGNEVFKELQCHSAASSPSSVSGSSLTLRGLREERCSWIKLELESRGLTGLWLEQQRRPSKEEAVNAPASWSWQNERGQKSQRDEAGAPQTLQSCHGHSQRPAGRRTGQNGDGKSDWWNLTELSCLGLQTLW